MSVLRLRRYGATGGSLICNPIVNDNYVLKTDLLKFYDKPKHIQGPVPASYFYQRSFSIDFWCYPKNITQEFQHYVHYAPDLTSNPVFRIFTRWATARMYLQWGDEIGGWTVNGFAEVSSSNGLNLNQWNYVGFAFNYNVDARVYLNGTTRTSTTKVTMHNPGTTNNFMRLMYPHDANSYIPDAGIMNLRVYNKALTAAEFDTVYAAGAVLTTPSALQSSVFRQWKFNQQNCRTVLESSADKANGLINEGYTDAEVQTIWKDKSTL